DVVATLLDGGLAFVDLLHAAAARGAALLPLNVRLTARELAFQLAESAAKLLVCEAGRLAHLAREAAALVDARARPERIELVANARAALEDRIAPSAPAYGERGPVDSRQTHALVYTSGTTGTPKGALLSQRALFWSAIGSGMRLGLAPADRWLVCMPLYHVGGFSILLRCTLFGSSAILHERFDAERVDRALDEDGVTLVSLVPTMLARVLDARGARRAPRGLRCVLLGGGPAPRELVDRARSRGFPVATSYGLTEASSQVATQHPTLARSRGCGGLRPLVGTEIAIVDGSREPLHGRAGEIIVRGPTLMSGYQKRPAETARALQDGWLYTGDVGAIDATGALEVFERRRDLIISGGENVYPAEVERVLAEHPAVAEAAVAARADDEFGQRAIAWVVAKRGERLDALELRRFCAERLAAYKIPVEFRNAETLPRNELGKLLREKLA
ncbi:MAG TPA: o-succinylbenzoate--CoA ligase, partial [Myxococcota bacterium]|nr:o-succinylbenzoate--CoA ligase [Myxococcota bacterium]